MNSKEIAGFVESQECLSLSTTLKKGRLKMKKVSEINLCCDSHVAYTLSFDEDISKADALCQINILMNCSFELLKTLNITKEEALNEIQTELYHSYGDLYSDE